MWQLNRIFIHWVPPALALALASACSQAPTPNGEVMASSSPAIVQAEASPTTSPIPSASLPPVEVDEPSASVAPPARQIPAASSTDRPQPVAKVDVATKTGPSDSLRPTFRAEQRMAGFSPDGNYYVYLESSRDTGAGIPKSSLQVVDVSSSNCVANGCIETRYGETAVNLDLKDAEADLLKQTWKIRQELNLTPPAKGTELPMLSRSRSADGTETVTVRLGNDQPLRLRLRQQRTGANDGGEKAAMQLDVTYNGQQRSLDTLSNFRDFVLDYSIREIKMSPDGRRVAVLITAAKPTFEGTLGTTIVQGFEL